MKVLITGCHGDIGLSLLKILRSSFSKLIAIGSDAAPDGPGKIYFDEVHQLPRVTDEKYMNSLKALLKGVDFIIPASEPEIRYFGQNLPSNEIDGIKLITCNLESQKVGFDKWETYQFLKASELPYIKTVLGTQSPNFDFPVIYKPRAGAGSRGIHICQNAIEFNALSERNDNCLIQEYISDPGQEYTCCLFSDGNETRSIIVKRTMRYGLTLTAEPVKNEKIDATLLAVAKKLKLRGSINVQLRLDAQGEPKIFEINPRFSSTVFYRHAIGFKDLVWSIEMVQGRKLSDYSGFERKKLYRHFEDGLLDY